MVKFSYLACVRVTGLYVHPKQTGFAARKFDDIGDAGIVENTHNTVGDIGFGVDNEVDRETGLSGNAAPVIDFVSPHSDHFDTNFRFDIGDQTRQKIRRVRIPLRQSTFRHPRCRPEGAP